MLTRIAVLLAGLVFSFALSAQGYPSKPIRFFVPYPPGGGTDIVARALGQKLQEYLGKAIVIENRPGASEMIGTEALARSAADGYTMELVTDTFAINASLQSKLPYDTERDFAPVTKLVNVPFLMVAHPSVPVTTVQELVQLARSQPGKLNYAHLGPGSPHYLAMEWFKYLAGVNIVGVPYKGGALGMTALSAGEVQLMFTGLTAGLAQVRAGRLRALAVSPGRRVSAASELPTVAEGGYPDFDIMTWYGVVVPGETPQEIVARLNSEIVKALGTPDIRQRFAAIGVEIAPMTAAGFSEFIRREVLQWGRIIKATGAKPD